MRPRSGSFLIVCLSLMALMIILAFAIIHDLQQQVDTSTGNQRYLLAEAAARSGLEHATLQIVNDYVQTTMSLPSVAGPVTVPAVTFLDGPFRAPFCSITNPNTCVGWIEGNSPTDDDDVRFEDWVMRPWKWWWTEGNWQGNQMYDGRGRYYEPGYYNLTTAPAGSRIPVAPVPFLDLGTPVPERSQAMFYDEQFRRIPPSGNPQLDRKNARYRLRYVVGVEDLSGHILMNPLPNMQMLCDQPTPADYRTPAATYPWMRTAINALANLGGIVGGGEFGSQMENVFQGRGYYTNVDLDHTATGINGRTSLLPYPKTFPLMYRSCPNPFGVVPAHWKYPGSPAVPANPNASPPTPAIPAVPPSGYIPADYSKEYWAGGDCWSAWCDGGYDSGNLSTELYFSQFYSAQNPTMPKGLATGGEILPPGCGGGGGNFWPYYTDSNGTIMHCLMGPQLSFDNIVYAVSGDTAGLSNPEFLKFALTPYGRGLTSTGYSPTGPNKWYQGRIDTPFYFNLLTAPPAVINSMLYGYVQPWIKTYAFYALQWWQVTPPDPATGWPNAPILLRTDAIDGSLAANQAYGYGRDLMVSTTFPPAFAQWLPPTRQDGNPVGAQNPPGATGIGQVISPDYYASDPRFQDPLDSPPLSGLPVTMYPGPFMNGNAANPGQGGDDLGLNMDEVRTLGFQRGGGAVSYGCDPYTWPNYSADGGYFLNYSVVNPSQTWGSFVSQAANAYQNWVGGGEQGPQPPTAEQDALAWTTPPTETPPPTPPATVVPPDGWENGGPNPGANFVTKVPNANSLITSHVNSYYFDLIGAMAQAIAVFRAEYIQFGQVFYGQGYNPWIGQIFGTGQDPQPQSYETLRDLDRLFLAEMGESLDAPGTNAPSNLGLTAFKPSNVGQGLTCPFVPYVPANNIWSLVQNHKLGSTVTTTNPNGTTTTTVVTDAERAHVMELLLNDFRMSFFGSSPAYSDTADPTKEFRPLDFLGDGHAYCSCYSGNDGDPIYPLPCAAPGTKPPCYFTITGTFFIGKSHFYRVFSRGEVWDNLLNHKMDEATLDSVLTVDPEGTDPTQTQFLYQRWFANRYQAMLPDIKR